MELIKSRLSRLPFLILDGAMASELERKGADLNDSLWSAKVLIEQPHLIKETHLDYLNAGADIICTSTYQATFAGFEQKGLTQKQSVDLFELSVSLAKEARDIYLANSTPLIRPLIAGSVGPYGAYLADGSEYRGKYNLSKRVLKSFHRQRIEILLRNKIDLLLFETFPDLNEIEAVNELIAEYAPCPTLFSFSCKNRTSLADGHALANAINLAEQNAEVEAFGINCLHPNLATAILKDLSPKIGKPLIVYPNNGNTWDATNKCWLNTGSDIDMKDHWQLWVDYNAKIIGGCCQTSPEYTRELFEFREVGYEIGSKIFNS